MAAQLQSARNVEATLRQRIEIGDGLARHLTGQLDDVRALWRRLVSFIPANFIGLANPPVSDFRHMLDVPDNVQVMEKRDFSIADFADTPDSAVAVKVEQALTVRPSALRDYMNQQIHLRLQIGDRGNTVAYAISEKVLHKSPERALREAIFTYAAPVMVREAIRALREKGRRYG